MYMHKYKIRLVRTYTVEVPEFVEIYANSEVEAVGIATGHRAPMPESLATLAKPQANPDLTTQVCFASQGWTSVEEI